MNIYSTYNKRIFIRAAVTVVFFIIIFYFSPHFFTSESDKYTCPNCNVILISIDTLGAKHLGLYGYDKPTSPFLDQLANERGIVFENAIAQSHWTLPSHAAMLTGQYPGDLGIWDVTDALPPRAQTIAEALQERGFVTQAFSNGSFIQPEWGFDQGFEGFSGYQSEQYWDDVPAIFNDALEWIGQTSSPNPFFLFIHSFQVHWPYMASEEAMRFFGAEEINVMREDVFAMNGKRGGPTVEDLERTRGAYDGEIRELDMALRDFFQEFDGSGLSKNTIVVFTSDHGEAFGEHGTIGHLAIYDEVIHVPLIFFMPDASPRRIATPMEVRSIPATILDVLGMPPDPLLGGESLFGDRTGKEAKDTIALSMTALNYQGVLEDYNTFRRRQFKKIDDIINQVIFIAPRQESFQGPFTASARSAEWHLIRNHDDSLELYNVLSDTIEQDNVIVGWKEFSESQKQSISLLFEALKINPLASAY